MDNDSQIPDLSGFSDPGDLPAPRPTAASSREAVSRRSVDDLDASPVRGPGAIPPQHRASLRDSQEMNQRVREKEAQSNVERNLPRDDVPEDEPYHGHSFLSSEDAHKHVYEQEENPPPPVRQEPRMSQKDQMPSVVKATPQRERKDIRELFTTGQLSRTIRIAGFDLRLRTVSADEYTRAWAMACMMPEGTARDAALRQYLLAFSCTHINDEEVENMCIKGEITDPVSKRANVFSRLDNELVRKFFDEGYVAIRQQSLEMLEKIDQEADSVGNFTHLTR